MSNTNDKYIKFSLPADIQPATIYGKDDENLHRIARQAGVAIETNDNEVEVSGGTAANRRAARDIINGLVSALRDGEKIAPGLVEKLLDSKIRKQPDEDKNLVVTLANAFRHAMLNLGQKGNVGPRNDSQAEYLHKIFNNEVAFGIGPAGTGKTYLAVAFAVHAFENDPHNIKKIILTRPAVEAGENLGFLPGDMKEKVDPYMRPLYDALYDLKGKSAVDNLIRNGEIEIAPLAFMRGRTLKNAIILLDEAQNTTPEQMKMFLTRMGERSRMIITGDTSQIDLPRGVNSGLVQALEALKEVEGLAIHRFTAGDVVRHPMVTKIVRAYEKLAP